MLNKVLMTAVFAAAGVMAASPSFAAVNSAAGAQNSSSIQPATGGMHGVQLAFTQRSVPVGNRSIFGQEWRCSINRGGTTFFSTDFSESRARAKLATRVSGHASCFRDRRFRFFGVD